MKTIDILAVGLVTIDFISEVDHFPKEGTTGPVRRSMTCIGGQIGRAALSCARLGARTCLTGMIGQGVYAELLSKQLAAEPLDVQLVAGEDESSSQHSTVIVSGDAGERTILWTPQPRATPGCLDVCAELVRQARCVLMDATDIKLALMVAEHCRKHGVPSIIDTGSYKPDADPVLNLIDYIIAPEKFFRARAAIEGLSYIDTIHAMRERHAPRLLVSTEGAEGGLYLERDSDEIRRYDPVPVKSVDSCGAGDVFHGGFAYAIAKGWPFSKALDFSAWLAAEKCKQFGNAGLPDATQIPTHFTRAQ